ncbi:hypothetical protein [Streptomyces sp. KL116D]|uniref:hypothetical protein n=1 Tax=Streptomyces sp. KL116D TaxID=3045152 RepID=UPI0035571019
MYSTRASHGELAAAERRLPKGTRIPLGPYTLETLPPRELRQLGPFASPSMPFARASSTSVSWTAHRSFTPPDPNRASNRSGAPWFDFSGPRPEARHWRALLPLILWDDNLLHIDAVFDVERGRNFGLQPNHVPTTIKIYEDRHGGHEEVEERDQGRFRVTRRNSRSCRLSAPP